MKKLLFVTFTIVSLFNILNTAYATPQYSYVPCPKCNQSCLFTEDSNIQYRGTPPIPIVYVTKTWQCSAYFCRLYMLKFNSDCLGCGGYGRGNCQYTKEYVWPFGYYNSRLDLCYSCSWRYAVNWWSQQ